MHVTAQLIETPCSSWDGGLPKTNEITQSRILAIEIDYRIAIAKKIIGENKKKVDDRVKSRGTPLSMS